jgi:hypothetical protein
MVAALVLAVTTPAVAHAALPKAVQHSNGQAGMWIREGYYGVDYNLSLNGFLKVGDDVFSGIARGSYHEDWNQPHPKQLTLTGPGLTAACTDSTGAGIDDIAGMAIYPVPGAGTVRCVGHVGSAPDAEFVLHVVLVPDMPSQDSRTSTWGFTGRFVG